MPHAQFDGVHVCSGEDLRGCACAGGKNGRVWGIRKKDSAKSISHVGRTFTISIGHKQRRPARHRKRSDRPDCPLFD